MCMYVLCVAVWDPVRVPGDTAGCAPLETANSKERNSNGTSTPRLGLDRHPVHGRAGKAKRGAQKPALLNDQARTRFCVEDHSHAKTDFCAAISIATINQKYSVEIKGKQVRG